MSINNKVIKRKRDYSLDALQGLLISYMIMVHAFQWANIKNDTFNEYASYIMFFFMPWFFYKSGMFHHSTSDLRTTLNKLARKLLIPYLVYSLLGECVHWSILYRQDLLSWDEILLQPLKEIILWGSVVGNMPLWFLLSFFAVKVIMCLADMYRISHVILLVFPLIIAGGGSLLIEYINHFPCLLLSTSLGLIFYLFGNYLKEKQYSKFVLIGALIIYVAIIIFIPSGVDFRSDKVTRGLWITYVIGSIAGIILFNNIFKLRILQIPYLSNIGRNSLDYYCIHWIVFGILSLVCGFFTFKTPNYYQFYSYILSAIILIPIYIYWKQFYNPKWY